MTSEVTSSEYFELIGELIPELTSSQCNWKGNWKGKGTDETPYVFCTVSYVNSAMLVKHSFGKGFSLLEMWKPFLATWGCPKILLCIPYSMWMYVRMYYRRPKGSTN